MIVVIMTLDLVSSPNNMLLMGNHNQIIKPGYLTVEKVMIQWV